MKHTHWSRLLIFVFVVGMICSPFSAEAFFTRKKNAKVTTDQESTSNDPLTSQLKATKEKYDAAILALTETIQVGKEKIISLQKQKKEVVEQIKKSETAIRKLLSVNEERYQELEGQQTILSKIEAILEENKKRMGDLGEQIDMQKIFIQKDRLVAELQSKIHDAEIRIKELLQKNENYKKRGDKELAQLRKESVRHITTIERLRKQLDDSKKETVTQKQANDELALEIKRLQAEIHNTHEEKAHALKNVSSSISEFEQFLKEQSE